MKGSDKDKPVNNMLCIYLYVYLVNYIFPVLDEQESALVAVCVLG